MLYTKRHGTYYPISILDFAAPSSISMIPNCAKRSPTNTTLVLAFFRTLKTVCNDQEYDFAEVTTLNHLIISQKVIIYKLGVG